MKVVFKGQIIAESNNTVIVEGNHYFSSDSDNFKYLSDSGLQIVCPWKGTVSYYNGTVDGEILKDAAWYYPEPSSKAKNIKGYLAFWNGVKVED